MKRCDIIMKFLKDWILYIDIYSNIDDLPSNIKNLDWFIQHRHDQSIFNLLLKTYKLNNYNLNSAHNKYSPYLPIIVARNRTGTSIIPNDKNYVSPNP